MKRIRFIHVVIMLATLSTFAFVSCSTDDEDNQSSYNSSYNPSDGYKPVDIIDTLKILKENIKVNYTCKNWHLYVDLYDNLSGLVEPFKKIKNPVFGIEWYSKKAYQDALEEGKKGNSDEYFIGTRLLKKTDDRHYDSSSGLLLLLNPIADSDFLSALDFYDSFYTGLLKKRESGEQLTSEEMQLLNDIDKNIFQKAAENLNKQVGDYKSDLVVRIYIELNGKRSYFQNISVY